MTGTPPIDTYSYSGAQDQGSAAADYNTKDFHIDQRLAAIRTSILVQVIKPPYDKNGNTITPGTVGPIGYIDVQPMVNQLDGNGQAMPHGTVYRVSYYRHSGANGAIITDPAKGDIGHMVINDRDVTSVRANNAISNPGSRRKFDLADGTYFGSPQSGTPTQCIAFTTSGITISDKNGNVIALASGGITLTLGAGHIVTVTAGGTPHFVLVNGGSGVSTVLKADG